ncbi:MAG: penicillin acylase family protein [Proteobacteria bacterium]|nr:penicillin acylase family protein [Pseudomonadota bacterium]
MSRAEEGAERGAAAALAIVAAIALGLLAALWFGGRWIAYERQHRSAVPTTSGTLHVVGIDRSVEVVRDERGVARVRAAGEAEAWFGAGFVHAQDRLAQMLWLRRLARGHAAEVAGEGALASDRLARPMPRWSAWTRRCAASSMPTPGA